jgi:F0F1-type ATP synthase epsilon subunit
MADLLRLRVQTPHATVVDERVTTARVPTHTGQVGLRPREEPLCLVVEPGLILANAGGRELFIASAGGLLEGDRTDATLFTPFAVTGASDEEVLAALDDALKAPDSELAARRRLGELEQRIVQEVRAQPHGARAGGSHV